MQFSRQEYWSGEPFPPPGDLLDPGIEPRSPTLQVDSLPAEPPRKLKNTGVGSLSLTPGDLPNPGIEPRFPTLQMDYLLSEPPDKSLVLIAGSNKHILTNYTRLILSLI